MIIILKTNGQIVTDDGNPVEISTLDNAAMILADPQDGDTIVYDATSGMWKAGAASSGGSFNPDITSPQDGDTLVYNAAQSKWVNGAPSGGSLVVHDNDGTLDKTWKEIRDAFSNGYYVSMVDQSATDSFSQTQILFVEVADGKYVVGAGIMMQTWWYADSENGYPVIEQQ